MAIRRTHLQALRCKLATASLAFLAVTALAQSPAPAPSEEQRRQAEAPLAPYATADGTASARLRSHVNLTGWWVAYVTEDWIMRMVTPPKGDVVGLPLNAKGVEAANKWDWEHDIQQHDECKAFGAAGLMRMPTRLHIEWQDENLLRLETDAGEQQRLLKFGGGTQAQVPPSWQGVSSAEWESAQLQASGLRIATLPPSPPSFSLKVLTVGMRSGYLRSNGVPYSDQTVMTEYFDVVTGPNGQDWLLVTSIVDDPVYLIQPYVSTFAFKRERDGSRWHPSACYLDKPTRGPLVVPPQGGLGGRPIHWPTYPDK